MVYFGGWVSVADFLLFAASLGSFVVVTSGRLIGCGSGLVVGGLWCFFHGRFVVLVFVANGGGFGEAIEMLVGLVSCGLGCGYMV